MIFGFFTCFWIHSIGIHAQKRLRYLYLKRHSANTNICLITLETHLVRMSEILKTVGWTNCGSRRLLVITGKFSPFLQSCVQNKNDDKCELLWSIYGNSITLLCPLNLSRPAYFHFIIRICTMQVSWSRVNRVCMMDEFGIRFNQV